MRPHYWTCSSFADWLRGTMKPYSETSAGWKQWREEAKKNHPIRYWLAEEGLDFLQNIIMWPADKYNDIRYYIKNRFVVRPHALTAHPRDIAPGTWCDVGHRFLPCMFNELVDFVEIEKAWSHVIWSKDEREKYKAPDIFWRRINPFHRWRCPEAGLDHLKWEMQLTTDEHAADYPFVGEPTYQAIAAREQYELYIWWTQTRPARPDASAASGWDALYYKKYGDKDSDWLDELGSNKSPEYQKASAQALNAMREIEDKYEQEDEEMLIRLIKIRNSLWT